MGKLLAISLIILVLGLTGCTLLMPPEAPAESTTQAAVNEVESGISEIDALEQELDISELEELEQDLDEINW
jgi:hypothetical protein